MTHAQQLLVHYCGEALFSPYPVHYLFAPPPNVGASCWMSYPGPATPGAYTVLSHIIAVVTITMALLALVRLRPALRRLRRAQT